jgi:hypothetical protein
MAKKVKKAGKARKAAAKKVKKAAPTKAGKAASKKARNTASKKARKAAPGKAGKAASKPKRTRSGSRSAMDAAPAAEEVVVVARDVPENMVDVTIEGFMNAGATRVTKTRQPDGKYTITAYFAD